MQPYSAEEFDSNSEMSCGQLALAAMSGLGFQPLTPQNKAHVGKAPYTGQITSSEASPSQALPRTSQTTVLWGQTLDLGVPAGEMFHSTGMNTLQCASCNMLACLPGGSHPSAISRSRGAPLPQEPPSWAQQQHFLLELLTGCLADLALY